MSKKSTLIRSILASVAFGIFTGPAQAEIIKYDLWLSRSDSAVPHEPFHDCLVVDTTAATVSFSDCPGGSSLTAYPGIINVFGSTCGGTTLRGWFANGGTAGVTGAGDVIGGVMWRYDPALHAGRTWGFQGVRNDACAE